MPMRRRLVRVATVTHKPTAGADSASGMDTLTRGANVFIDRLAKMGADLIAFPEFYPQAALSDPYHHAEPTESGSLDRIREAARMRKVMIVWPRLEYDTARGMRNTSILIDRDGEVVGRYDKMFPTIGEIEKGVVPGTSLPVFETDFGRVGLLVCFDLNFRETHDELARGQPDIVVFSSMYRGGLQAQALAYDLGSFVVTSVPKELGLIIDRGGRVLKESTYEGWAIASINTNSVALHMDGNWNKMDAMLAKHGSALTFDYHTREGTFVIEAAEDRSIENIVSEFALEPLPAYYARSRRLRSESLAKFQKTAARL